MNAEMEDLKIFGRSCLEMARSQILATRDVTPILVFSFEGKLELMGVDQRVLKSEIEKANFSEIVKQRVRESGVTAVAAMFDSELFEVPSSFREKVLGLREAGLSSRQIAQLGLGRYSEAVVFTIDMKSGEGVQMTLEYRASEKGVEFDPVRVEEIVESSGRMYFFGG